jgi:hypothetical protein
MWNEANQILNQTAERIRRGVVDFLPGLLALVLAWIVRSMVGRSLRRFEFDRRARQWGFPALIEWSPSKSPTLLMARLSFWTVMLMGALAGMSALDANLTRLLAIRLFAYFPNVLAALLSLGVKWLVMVLAGAMALNQLGIGGDIVKLSFGILFGGIVLALALAVGLGSKDMVSRTWERQSERAEEEPSEQFHHL